MRGDLSTPRAASTACRISRFSRVVASALALAIATGAPALSAFAATAPNAEPKPASAAPSFSVEQIFPAGTLLAFSIPDFRKSVEAFKGTALYEIWNEQQLQKFLEKPLAMLNSLPAMMQQQMTKMPGGGKGLDPDQLASIPGGDIAIGITSVTIPPDVSDQNPPDIGLVVAMKLGNEKAFDGLLDAVEAMAKSHDPNFVREKVDVGGVQADSFGDKTEPVKLFSAKSNGVAVLSISKSALASTLAALAGKSPAGGTLASDPNYTAVARDARSQSELAFGFINFEAIFKAIDPIAPPPVKAVLAASGLTSLKSVAFSTSFQGKGFADVGIVYAPGEPKGLLKALPNQPIDLKLLDMIPQDVTSFTIRQFDVGPLWTSIWDMIRAVDPEKENEAKGMLGQFETQTGVKIKDDLIDSFGTKFIYYQRGMQNGQIFPDIALYLQIKNQDKLREAMGKLSKLAQGVALKEVKIADSTYYYVDVSAIAPIPYFQPSYAFADDFLILSLNLQSLKSIINGRKSQTFVPVKENEEFKAILPKIPQGVTSLSYTDTKRSFGSMYESVKGLIPLLMMTAGTELPIDVALLPTSDTFTRHLYGSYDYSVPTTSGARSLSVGPFSTLLIVPIAIAGAAVAGVMAQSRASSSAAPNLEPGSDDKDKDSGEQGGKKPEKEPKF